MTTQLLSDPDSNEERWALFGSRGCCSFEVVFEAGQAFVHFSDGCHRCINELNVLALERNYILRRRGRSP